MAHVLHANACNAIPAIACAHSRVPDAKRSPMKGGWEKRLREAIDEDGRSMRAISLASGLGPNYVEQTFNRGSSPTQNKLAAIMDQLGAPAALYIYTGVRMTPLTLKLLDHLSKVREDLHGPILELLQKFARGEASPEGLQGPPRDDPQESSPKP